MRQWPAVSQIRGSLSVTFPIFSQHSSASFKLICQLAARWRRNIFLKSSRLTVAFIDIEFPCSSAFVTILVSSCLSATIGVSSQLVFWFAWWGRLMSYLSSRLHREFSSGSCSSLFLSSFVFRLTLCTFHDLHDRLHALRQILGTMLIPVPGGKLEQPHLILTCLRIPTFSALTA